MKLRLHPVIYVLLSIFQLLTLKAFSQETVPVSTVLTQSPVKIDKKFSLELFNYEEYIYSRSKKTELGDQLELSTRFRYQFNDKAWVSLGFTTIPLENRFDNKTSDFEIRTGYAYKEFILQLDLSLNTNDNDGGITLGPDIDSRNTFLSYAATDKLKLIFYPFNFNGSTGLNFQNNNVATLYFIDGAPNQLDTLQLTNEKLARKTIPGLELNYSLAKTTLYFGLGAASYLYPTDGSFNVRENTGALKWERKEDFGYKAGAIFKDRSKFLSLQYVGHSESAETGALLSSSLNAYTLMDFSSIILETEVSVSEAGERPYRVDRRKDWFEVNQSISVDPKQRIYSDRQNNLQDWIAKTGYAATFKIGAPIALKKGKSFTPYLSYSYYDKNFVFDGNESVHKLRNKNESTGHGGLHKYGLGAYFYPETFVINPRFEYLKAGHSVFTNSSDIRNDSIASNFNSYDFQFFINVSYYYDKRTGPRTFRVR